MVAASALSHSVWAQARWLVLAPHPDDETLGAGALIDQAARSRRLGGIVYLTDGTGSHPPGTVGLAIARRREAGHAIQRLAGRRIPIDWLGWRDAHPHEEDSMPFLRDAQRLGSLLRRRRIDAVAVTGPRETHGDHVAAYRLASAACRAARRSIALFAYDVWSDGAPASGRQFRTHAMALGRRRQALHAHRSQLSNVYGEGFRLPPEKRRMAGSDRLRLQVRRA